MLVVGFFLGALVLTALAALLAAADAAVTVSSRSSMLELAERSPRRARALRAIADDPGAHLNAVNFCRISFEMTAAVLVTLAFEAIIEPTWLVLVVSALVMIGVSFILVGASPRGFGRTHAEGMLLATAALVRFSRLLIGPVSNALVRAGNRVTPGVPRSASFASEAQLLNMVDEAAELDLLEEDDRALIHSIFAFNETSVREVMIPRTDMVSAQASLTVGETLALFFETGVSRVPVIDGSVDDVVGVLYLRDLSRASHEGGAAVDAAPIRGYLRQPSFVPESLMVDALMQRMQLESNHLALVVDEYGGIAGLVTLEDVLEELVGEITDEYDTGRDGVTPLGGGAYRLSAALGLDAVGELFDVELDDEDVDSIGGLLAKLVGHLPVRGDRAEVAGLRLTAEHIQGKRRLTTLLAEPAAGRPGGDEPPKAEAAR